MKFSTSVVATALFMATTSMNAFVPSSFVVVPKNDQMNNRKRDLSHMFGMTMSTTTTRRQQQTLLSPRFMSTTATEPEKETYEFTSDVGRVMDLIINSLYSDKDIFLRELISNAADACDKKRFLSITSESNMKQTSNDLEIKIKCNPDENTITIEDAGVGMTKEELINNLGKIAQSGTRAFVDALGEGSADVNLIGQFGVGFYSAYLIANKVEVVTKSMQDGAKQYRWISEADSSYSILEDDSEPLAAGSGSRLILHLKDEASEYLESSKIEELLNRYSEFIEFPISIWKETTEYKQVPDEEANKDLKEGDEPKTKTVPITNEGYERVNNQKPIWLRGTKDVTDEEYKSFYKSAFRASYDDPMEWSHFVLEGQVECKSLLYIPGMLPFELSKDMFDENSRNIRLYVKRVFINDKFDELMPRWLKFVRGVVDSNDLPLNVSREILQKSKVLSIINKRLVRKSLDMMYSIAENEDKTKYIMFWNNFGKYIKVGVVEDDRNRKDIVPLLRFFSSRSGEEYTSFDEYVTNMKEGQKTIYYVTGDGRQGAEMSPVVEKLSGRGYEVLFCTEPLDEIMIESIREYKDFNIVDASKENLQLDADSDDEETKKKKETLQTEYKNVSDYLSTLLSDKIQKVIVSDLLTDSPAALVQGAYGMSPTMQRYMKAQAVAAGNGNDMGGMMSSYNKAVLEINPKHPIVNEIDRMVRIDKESDKLKNYATLLYDVAAMTSGYDIEDAKSFAQRVTALMQGIDDGSSTSGGIQDAEVEVVKGLEVIPSTTQKSPVDDVESKDVEVIE